MKDVLLVLLVLLVLVALGWLAWLIWGPQLSDLPGQLSEVISRALRGMLGSLAGLGQAVRDSFRMPGP